MLESVFAFWGGRNPLDNKVESQDKAVSGGRTVFREYFESICTAIILALFIRTFVVQAFKIPSESMEPNLLVGDHLLVNKMLYFLPNGSIEKALSPKREVRRHDVVVFKYPMDHERDFIKRVVALPGEKVRIENKQVFIDGEPLDEPFAHFETPPRPLGTHVSVNSRRDDMAEMVVPRDHYFVMGDNRDNSHDSRFWGPLPKELVKGRALVIYWSFDAPTEAYMATGFVEKVKGFGNVALNFYDQTRWERFFHLVR
jgi:signal peptidase I